MRDPQIGEILVQPDELKERVRALGEAVSAPGSLTASGPAWSIVVIAC